MEMDKERSGLLATVERKEKLRIGALKESEEALFRDIMVLEDRTAEMERGLREGGEDLLLAKLEWRRIEAKERRDTDAAGRGVTWKAASGAQSSEAEIGSCGDSGVGVNRKGSLGITAPRAVLEVRRKREKRWYGKHLLRRESLDELGVVPTSVSGVARTPQGQVCVRQELQRRGLQVLWHCSHFGGRRWHAAHDQPL